jgi:hypothetical protein
MSEHIHRSSASDIAWRLSQSQVSSVKSWIAAQAVLLDREKSALLDSGRLLLDVLFALLC